MFKRALASLAALILGLGAALLGVTSPASATTNLAGATCGYVYYGFAGYADGSSNVFTLHVDGVEVVELTFEEALNTDYYLLDPTKSHEVWWQVDASHDPDQLAPPTVTSPCVVDATCASAIVNWGAPLAPNLRATVEAVTADDSWRIEARVVGGVPGGAGDLQLGLILSVSTIALSGGTPTETLAMQPLTAAEVVGGQLVIDYADFLPDPSLLTVLWVTANGVAIPLGGPFDCGFADVIPAAPTFTPPGCSTGGTLVLEPTDGVIWSGGAHGAGPGTYSLTATAAFGYRISGPSVFTVTVPAADRANCELVAAFATMAPGTCVAGGGTYSLSDTDGVIWLADGHPVSAGTYQAAPSTTVELEASLSDATRFAWDDPDDPTSWEFTFAAPFTTCDPPTLALTGSSGAQLLTGAAVLLVGGSGLYFARRHWLARAR